MDFTDRLWSLLSPAWGRWTVWGRSYRWGWRGCGRHHLQLSGCSGSLWRLWRNPQRSLNTAHAHKTLGLAQWKLDWLPHSVHLPQVSTRTSCSSILFMGTSEFSTTTSPVRGRLITQLVASKCPRMRNLGSEFFCKHKASSTFEKSFKALNFKKSSKKIKIKMKRFNTFLTSRLCRVSGVMVKFTGVGMTLDFWGWKSNSQQKMMWHSLTKLKKR